MKPSFFPRRNGRISLFGRQGSAGSASQSEAMTVAAGLSQVCVYRGRCARGRSAAFTPLPRGTVPVTLRIFPSAADGRTVKRPEGRAPAALGRGALHVLSPRGGSAKTGRRGATLEGIDCLFGSGVAPRRAPFPHHYSVGSSPRLPSRRRSATSRPPTKRAHLDTATGAPVSGPAPLREPEPETPGRRPALRHSMFPLLAVSRRAPTKHAGRFVVD